MSESSTVRGFRQIVQDLLVPEFKVLQFKVDSNTAEIKSLSEKIDKEIKILSEKMDKETKILSEKMDKETKTVSEKVDRLTEITIRLSEQFDTSTKPNQVLERLSKVEQKLDL